MMTTPHPFTAPLRHRSAIRIVGPFVPPSLAVEHETPLFAAEPGFARDRGGPITRAFIKTLPVAWKDDVLIDSSLVWLSPGIAHSEDVTPRATRENAHRSPPRFYHEPFPGISTGVRGESNRNLRAVHRLCILGLECTPEVAEGEIAFSDAAAAAAFWLPAGAVDVRECEIDRRLESGGLARRTIPLSTVVEFGWGALMRARPAEVFGFQLVLRATARDARPAVNGLRNLSML